MRKLAWIALSLMSSALVIASVAGWSPFGPAETLGFVSGAVCVGLVVEQNIWNFPVGIANNAVFIVLFLTSRLYGDMALQVVYIVLGIIGWRQWLHGGKDRTRLRVSHTTAFEAALLVLVGTLATVGLREYLRHINDASPFLDALTTVLSLLAQYLLNSKRFENWFVWIAADILYVWLYLQRDLYLTALLYAVFIGLCIAGLWSWSKALRAQRQEGSPR